MKGIILLATLLGIAFAGGCAPAPACGVYPGYYGAVAPLAYPGAYGAYPGAYGGAYYGGVAPYYGGACGYPGGAYGNNVYGNQAGSVATGANAVQGADKCSSQQGWNNAAANGAAQRYGQASQAASSNKAAAVNSNAGQCVQNQAYKNRCANEVLVHNIKDSCVAGNIASSNAFVNSNARQACNTAAAAQGVNGNQYAQNVAQNAGAVGNCNTNAYQAANQYGANKNCATNGAAGYTAPAYGAPCATPFYW
ncbi:hypothetical protein PAPYR_6078 [Paratrimastix pyriformis]|uniref:Uncharacterized protein n=1 Tax=Paratrimastix pyriformis TaxID=342808 RepID=A0ABQ8UHI9_9EUKA|nr:hypothetical protein PAPYR_6078 [Paratrimastix pyriformis]